MDFNKRTSSVLQPFRLKPFRRQVVYRVLVHQPRYSKIQIMQRRKLKQGIVFDSCILRASIGASAKDDRANSK